MLSRMRLADSLRLARGGPLTYTRKVLATAPLAYWPLTDAAGASVALDASGHGYNGTPTNVTFGSSDGIGDSKKSAAFGVNGCIDIYSAGLAGALNLNEITIMAWAQIPVAGTWTDTLEHRIIHLEKDNTAASKMGMVWTGARFDLYRRAGGHGDGDNGVDCLNLANSLKWFQIITVASVSGNYFKVYKNGKLIFTATGAQSWAGGFTVTDRMCIGAEINDGTQYFLGNLAHIAIWNRQLSQTEITNLYNVTPPAAVISPLDITGLKLWYKADTGTFQVSDGTIPAVADGDKVGYWGDQSGNGYNAIQATAGTRPALSLSTIPLIDFNGSVQLGLSPAPSIASGSFTIYMMGKPITGNSHNLFDSQTGRLVATTNSSTGNIGWYDGAWKLNSTAATAAHQILSWVLTDGGNGEVFQNGVSLGTAAYSKKAIGGNTNLGSVNGGGGTYWGGKLFEFLLYAGAHTPTQRAQIEAYLAARSGLTI